MSRPVITERAYPAAPAPRVSVFMPVHNGEPYVGAAISSVLGQTLADFELVVVENGSTDTSLATVRAAAARDRRIRVIESPHPLGVVGAANVAIDACRAPLIARHDQDDLSHPTRLERQVAALDSAPAAVAVGTLSDGIDDRGRTWRPRDRWRLVRHSMLPPFPHGSVCLRRDVFHRIGGYRDGTFLWEDVDLFLRLTREGEVLVLPDALYRYRYHRASATAADTGAVREDGAALMWQCVEEYRRGGDWTPLLRPGVDAPAPTSSGRWPRDDMSLWTGGPPPRRAGRGAALRRAWQRASPRTLRASVRTVVRVRDLAATVLLSRRGVVRWRPR